jgi:hypothetical protein
MLKKEKDGSLFKDTKLAHPMMLACLDEFLKISQETPVGKLVNQSDSFLSGLELPPGTRKDKGQFPSNLGVPLHDPPAPPEDTEPPPVVDSMNKMQSAFLKFASDVTYTEASTALQKLKKLEAENPTKGELARNAMAGAAVMPVMGTVSGLVSGKQPLVEALRNYREGLPGAGATRSAAWKKGLSGTGRGMAASAVSGMALGAGMPLVRGYLHREAEKEKLRQYLGEKKRGKLRNKIKRTVGL